MGNKYLYQKVMSSDEETVQLLPTAEDLAFLDKMHIKYKNEQNNYVTINKAQFMKKIAA